MKLGRSHAQLSQPALYAFGEKIDERRMVIGTRDLLEGFTPSFHERVTSLLLKLFERLEAIRRKRG